MSIWDNLKSSIAPKEEKTEKQYKFASEEFIKTFTKLANDFGCSENEIEQHLDFLEKNYQTNHDK